MGIPPHIEQRSISSGLDEARASKRQKLMSSAHSEGLRARQSASRQSDPLRTETFGEIGTIWSSEQDYERMPRVLKSHPKSFTRLPIKTAAGAIEQVEQIDQDDHSVLALESELESDNDANVIGAESLAMPTHHSQIPLRQQLVIAKEELARVASQIVEDPEENVGSLRTLARLCDSPISTVKKLGLATQMSVFRDVIPGYRIRPGSEPMAGEKLSKDVRKLRNFEESLLSAYQFYLKDLSACAKSSQKKIGGISGGVASMAINCACALLLAVPHFNFRSDLITILVERLSFHSYDSDFAKCLDTFVELFQNDDDGKPSFEAVGMLSKLIKNKQYRVDERILHTFLHLRLLSEFSHKASKDHVDEEDLADDHVPSKEGKRKAFRTKRHRKMLKEQNKIEKEFKEADAVVDKEHREQMQAETLKVVFSTYFRILKAEDRKLIGPVLEGLARFAHLINQDFFGDLLEVLKDLIRNFEVPVLNADEEAPNQLESLHDTLRPILLCIRTAFALLEGQDAAKSATLLGIDLTYFVKVLYRNLHMIALDSDLEVSNKKARSVAAHPDASQSTSMPNPASSFARVNVQTTSVLLLRATTAALTPRSTPPNRLAAYIKQLYIVSLQLPEKSCIANMELLNTIVKIHSQKLTALWNTEERRGDGRYDPERPDLEGCNPFASTIWEGEMLKHHFCPTIRVAVKGVAKQTARAT